MIVEPLHLNLDVVDPSKSVQVSTRPFALCGDRRRRSRGGPGRTWDGPEARRAVCAARWGGRGSVGRGRGLSLHRWVLMLRALRAHPLPHFAERQQDHPAHQCRGKESRV